MSENLKKHFFLNWLIHLIDYYNFVLSEIHIINKFLMKKSLKIMKVSREKLERKNRA